MFDIAFVMMIANDCLLWNTVDSMAVSGIFLNPADAKSVPSRFYRGCTQSSVVSAGMFGASLASSSISAVQSNKVQERETGSHARILPYYRTGTERKGIAMCSDQVL